MLSPSTIEGYRNVERNRLSEIADIEIADFDTITAQKYINQMARKLSAKSVANAWGLVCRSGQAAGTGEGSDCYSPSKKKSVSVSCRPQPKSSPRLKAPTLNCLRYWPCGSACV